MSIAYGKYANDGIRDEGFRTFGNCWTLLLYYLNYFIASNVFESQYVFESRKFNVSIMNVNS